MTTKQQRKCEICKRPGLTLDRDGLCHECWQDARDAEQRASEASA